MQAGCRRLIWLRRRQRRRQEKAALIFFASVSTGVAKNCIANEVVQCSKAVGRLAGRQTGRLAAWQAGGSRQTVAGTTVKMIESLHGVINHGGYYSLLLPSYR